jgi:hypothetical protein
MPRRLLILFLFVVAGCGDGSSPSQAPRVPEQLRSCGELEGIDLVEPVVTGVGVYGCPIFDPVPCTQPRDAYEGLCGDGCNFGTATHSNGDEWAVGCAPRLPCGGPDSNPFVLCHEDPASGDRLFYGSGGMCPPLYEGLWCSWPPCDEELPSGACE